MRSLSSPRGNRVVLDVRETNVRPQLFFKTIMVLPKFLEDSDDDCVEYGHMTQFRVSQVAPSDIEIME